MNDGPVVLLSAPKFRVVKLTEGAKVAYVFEKADGCDALGVERWRELKFGEADTTARMLRDWVIDQVKENGHAEDI